MRILPKKKRLEYRVQIWGINTWHNYDDVKERSLRVYYDKQRAISLANSLYYDWLGITPFRVVDQENLAHYYTKGRIK